MHGFFFKSGGSSFSFIFYHLTVVTELCLDALIHSHYSLSLRPTLLLRASPVFYGVLWFHGSITVIDRC